MAGAVEKGLIHAIHFRRDDDDGGEDLNPEQPPGTEPPGYAPTIHLTKSAVRFPTSFAPAPTVFPTIVVRDFDDPPDPESSPPHDPPMFTASLHTTKTLARITPPVFPVPTVFPTSLGTLLNRDAQPTDESLGVVVNPAGEDMAPDGAFSPDEDVPTWVSPRPHPTVKSRIRVIEATAATVDKR